MIKRVIALAVCLVCLLSILPLSACTGEIPSAGDTTGGGNTNIQPKNRLWYE